MRQSKTTSLRIQITQPYTYLIMVLSIALIILSIIISYQNSLKFIRDLELERSENIKDEIIDFLDSPFKVNQLNMDLYESGIIQSLSPDDLRIFFANQYKHFGNLSLVGFGMEDGTYFDVQYLDDEDLYSSERNPGTDDSIGWRINQSGKIMSIETVIEYDHRVRPWYTAAKENKEREPDWTPIYMTINPKSLFLSATSPVYSDSEEFLGVMVSSLSLTEIGHIIRSFQSLGSMDVYILERDGKMVASTQLEIPFSVINGDPVRMHVGDSQDEVLSRIFQSNSIEENDEKLMWIGLNPYFVGVYSINDGRGLDWQMFIANPADEILRDIGIGISLILTFAMITIVIGIWIGRRIGIGICKPILEIKNAANQIVLGNLKEKVIVYKDDEVGQMGLSFNKMGETIYDLVNNLEEMVDDRTRELEISKQRLSLHIENTPLGVIEWDEKFNILAWNPGAENIFGYKEEEVVGIHSAELLLCEEDENLSEIYKVLSELAENTGGTRSINKNKTRDGRIIHCDWYNTTLVDNSGKVYGVASLVLDITQQVEYMEKQKEIQKKLATLSQTDGLTGIANRRSFKAYLKKEWERAERNKSSISFIIADIDFFKNYNDYYGHLAGDQCLKTIAQTIDNAVRRPADMVFRYGGEEFGCLLPETDNEGAVFTAGVIQKSIESLRLPHENIVEEKYVTLSIGVATMIPNEKLTSNDLINSADKRLYYAKNNGRNQICSS